MVTGGSGRLGSYVVDALLPDYEVTVLDRVAPRQDVSFIRADIEDRDSLYSAFAEIDAVVQLAALDTGIVAEQHEYFRINVQGLWNVLEFAEAAGVSRTVVCSSVSAMNISRENPPRYLPVDVDHPAAPVHAYGISKLAGEVVAQAFSRRSSMEVFCLRPALVLRDSVAYCIAELMAATDGTAPPPPASDPTWEARSKPRPGSRSFVSPTDAANCFRAALEAEVPEFDIFHVVAADNHSDLATLDVVQREFGVSPEFRDAQRYANDPRASIYDISRTRDILGWEPRERWADVLSRVVASKESR